MKTESPSKDCKDLKLQEEENYYKNLLIKDGPEQIFMKSHTPVYIEEKTLEIKPENMQK